MWKAGTLPSQAKKPRHWRTREALSRPSSSRPRSCRSGSVTRRAFLRRRQLSASFAASSGKPSLLGRTQVEGRHDAPIWVFTGTAMAGRVGTTPSRSLTR